MVTEADYQRLRGDTGHSIATLPDPDAEALYVLASQRYSAGSAYAGARVLTILQLLGSASKLRKYVQNNSTEDASVVFQNLLKLLKVWQDELDKVLADEAEVATASSAQSMRVPVVSAW